MAREVNPEVAGRELDVLLSTGERVTIALLCMTLEHMGYPALVLGGRCR